MKLTNFFNIEGFCDVELGRHGYSIARCKGSIVETRVPFTLLVSVLEALEAPVYRVVGATREYIHIEAEAVRTRVHGDSRLLHVGPVTISIYEGVLYQERLRYDIIVDSDTFMVKRRLVSSTKLGSGRDVAARLNSVEMTIVKGFSIGNEKTLFMNNDNIIVIDKGLPKTLLEKCGRENSPSLLPRAIAMTGDGRLYANIELHVGISSTLTIEIDTPPEIIIGGVTLASQKEVLQLLNEPEALRKTIEEAAKSICRVKAPTPYDALLLVLGVDQETVRELEEEAKNIRSELGLNATPIAAGRGVAVNLSYPVLIKAKEHSIAVDGPALRKALRVSALLEALDDPVKALEEPDVEKLVEALRDYGTPRAHAAAAIITRILEGDKEAAKTLKHVTPVIEKAALKTLERLQWLPKLGLLLPYKGPNTVKKNVERIILRDRPRFSLG